MATAAILRFGLLMTMALNKYSNELIATGG